MSKPIDIRCPTCCSRPGEKCMTRGRNYAPYFHIRRELEAREDSLASYIRKMEALSAIEKRRSEVDY